MRRSVLVIIGAMKSMCGVLYRNCTAIKSTFPRAMKRNGRNSDCKGEVTSRNTLCIRVSNPYYALLSMMPCNRLQYHYIPVCFKNALMEQFDWLMVYQKRMAVWNSATGGCGAQCVMTIGTTMMRQWCAGSWAIVQSVSARGVFTCKLQLRRVHKNIALCNASYLSICITIHV